MVEIPDNVFRWLESKQMLFIGERYMRHPQTILHAVGILLQAVMNCPIRFHKIGKTQGSMFDRMTGSLNMNYICRLPFAASFECPKHVQYLKSVFPC